MPHQTNHVLRLRPRNQTKRESTWRLRRRGKLRSITRQESSTTLCRQPLYGQNSAIGFRSRSAIVTLPSQQSQPKVPCNECLLKRFRFKFFFLEFRVGSALGFVHLEILRLRHLRAKPSCTQRTGEHAILQSMNRQPGNRQPVNRHPVNRQPANR